MPREEHRRLAPAAAAIACLLLAAGGTALAATGAALVGGHDQVERALHHAAVRVAGNASPDGANDFSCRPGARHPRPVVLVHGTFNNMRQTWNTLSPQLAAQGYCVFALNYGDVSGGVSPVKAVGGIAASARELATFVRRVRHATGAARVDLVGYSQGGLLARQYLRFEGGERQVQALVALAPSNRGTKTLAAEAVARFGLSTWLVRRVCPACADQLWSSDLVRELNLGSMTLPGIEYTVISTVRDGVVVPYTSQQLPPGPRVTNVTLQDVCPGDRATHLSIPRDRVALGWVRHALDPTRTAPPSC